ncbi:MAG: excinuclease ABC subunit UvrA, partial [Verrucomicrobiota bacterium]
MKSSRSTIGTMTEINDYLKLLMPRIARAFCPGCGREIRPETAQSIADYVLREFSGKNVLLTFWVGVPAKTPPREFFDFIQQQGYLRVWIENEIIRVDSDKKIKRLGARVQVIQDRIAISETNGARLVEAIETALRFGKDRINIIALEEKNEHPFSTGWHCAHCDLDIRPPTPGLFSFNNPLGACPECRGFGRTIAIDLNKAIPDRALSIAQGAVRVFRGEEMGESQRDLMRGCAREEINVHTPFEELPKSDQDFVINGEARDEDTDVEELAENDRWYGVRGFFKWLESKTYKMHVRVLLSRYRAYVICPACEGGRYQAGTLNYRIVSPVNGSAREIARTLPELAQLSIDDARKLFANLALSPNDSTAAMLRDEIVTRFRYLCEVGLGYLTLDRSTRTLSGGEVQRVNLTTCLGASLVNTLFVMDEPSIGLHPRDVGRLVEVMHDLRDKGNTLLVVEHEEQIIRAADNLIDIGPGRGEQGGELVFSGALEDFVSGRVGVSPAGEGVSRSRSSRRSHEEERLFRQDAETGGRDAHPTRENVAPSLTREYLAGEQSIPIPKSRRQSSAAIKIAGAREHNLKNVDVEIPLGIFSCITGVSGSGKSTLIHEVLYRNLLRAKGQPSEQEPGKCKSVTGAHRIGDVVMVDQSMLARTPRSTPILYLGLYDRVRELFAAQPEAMAQGLTASAFSFNSGNGRCERCGGTGFEKIEMQFLSDLYVRCAECEGRRFQAHVLRVRLHERSIHDVLQMTVSAAIQFFAQIGEREKLGQPLDVLDEVGLGYLRLGQPLNTLSGGESQRLKLVRHLADETVRARGNGTARGNLLIFDEPTTGLHFDDVAMLVKLFQRLVAAGNSLVVIEHNLEVIKCADWIIDLGPEAGVEGGQLVAAGTPESLAKVAASHTGRYLRPILSGRVGVSPADRRVSQRYSFDLDDEVLALRAAEIPPGKMPV